MTTRRTLIFAVAMALTTPTMAIANDRAQGIIDDLFRLGFTRVETARTFLGRTRIVAEGPQGRREIVVNPRTGEILRDLWEAADDDDDSGLLTPDDDDSGQGRGRGRGRGGDEADAESGDDADDGDDSGGNSGSGGGDDD